MDQRREEYYLPNGQHRTSCRSSVSHQFWKRFVVNIATAGFVFNKSSPPREWCGSPSQTRNNKKRDGSRDADDRLRDLLEWLEDFTDNTGDAELPASAHISQDSDSERPTKVVLKPRTHSIILTSQKTESAKSACEPK